MLHGKLVFFLGWRLLFWAATAGVAPHTSFLAFFFLTGATWRLVDSLGGSAHAISCFFLFDGCCEAEGSSPCHAKSYFPLSVITHDPIPTACPLQPSKLPHALKKTRSLHHPGATTYFSHISNYLQTKHTHSLMDVFSKIVNPFCKSAASTSSAFSSMIPDEIKIPFSAI